MIFFDAVLLLLSALFMPRSFFLNFSLSLLASNLIFSVTRIREKKLSIFIRLPLGLLKVTFPLLLSIFFNGNADVTLGYEYFIALTAPILVFYEVFLFLFAVHFPFSVYFLRLLKLL